MAYGNTLPPTGTNDLNPDDTRAMRAIIRIAEDQARRAGYTPWDTPILEHRETITQSIGGDTDIVSKEMFSVPSSQDLILRPEGTAPLMRAILKATGGQFSAVRAQYCGPMFRHEQPQAGRYRQFTQFGLECYGLDNAESDADIIATASAILDRLELSTPYTLHINSLGNATDRAQWRAQAIAYFTQHRDSLSDTSRQRLTTNPLRIYDSKDAGDQAIVAGAPSITYSAESLRRWSQVRTILDALGIPYVINPRLIRGLDYYTDTIFEYVADTGLGAQNTILAGGRYDGLSTRFGYPSIPAIGWAMGVERIQMLRPHTPDPERPTCVISMDPDSDLACMRITQSLRTQMNTPVVPILGKRLRRAMMHANRMQAATVIILGPDEIQAGMAVTQDMDSGERSTVHINTLLQ